MQAFFGGGYRYCPWSSARETGVRARGTPPATLVGRQIWTTRTSCECLADLPVGSGPRSTPTGIPGDRLPSGERKHEIAEAPLLEEPTHLIIYRCSAPPSWSHGHDLRNPPVYAPAGNRRWGRCDRRIRKCERITIVLAQPLTHGGRVGGFAYPYLQLGLLGGPNDGRLRPRGAGATGTKPGWQWAGIKGSPLVTF